MKYSSGYLWFVFVFESSEFPQLTKVLKSKKNCYHWCWQTMLTEELSRFEMSHARRTPKRINRLELFSVGKNLGEQQKVIRSNKMFPFSFSPRDQASKFLSASPLRYRNALMSVFDGKWSVSNGKSSIFQLFSSLFICSLTSRIMDRVIEFYRWFSGISCWKHFIEIKISFIYFLIALEESSFDTIKWTRFLENVWKYSSDIA